MYSIKQHRKDVAISGVAAMALVGLMLLCALGPVVVLATFGPWLGLPAAAVGAGVWWAFGVSHVHGYVHTLARILVWVLNGLVAVSSIVRILQ
jgi:hypothetical protein